MMTTKAVVEGIKKESKPLMHEKKYNGFRIRRWNINTSSNVQTNNRRGVC